MSADDWITVRGVRNSCVIIEVNRSPGCDLYARIRPPDIPTHPFTGIGDGLLSDPEHLDLGDGPADVVGGLDDHLDRQVAHRLADLGPDGALLLGRVDLGYNSAGIAQPVVRL